jgi:hypothetical protein
MPSFTITAAPIYRVFSVDESKAIHQIEIDGKFVEIIFQSNTEKAYLYAGTDRMIAHLIAMLRSPDLLGNSLGATIAKARKNGDLEIIEFSED